MRVTYSGTPACPGGNSGAFLCKLFIHNKVNIMYDKNVCPDKEPRGCADYVIWGAIIGIILGIAIYILALTS